MFQKFTKSILKFTFFFLERSLRERNFVEQIDIKMLGYSYLMEKKVIKDLNPLQPHDKIPVNWNTIGIKQFVSSRQLSQLCEVTHKQFRYEDH